MEGRRGAEPSGIVDSEGCRRFTNSWPAVPIAAAKISNAKYITPQLPLIFEWGFIVGEALRPYLSRRKGREKGSDASISRLHNDSDMGDAYDVAICRSRKGALRKFVEPVLFNGKYTFEMDFLRGPVFDTRVEDTSTFLVLPLAPPDLLQ